jgi:hypothetical protein
MLLQPEVNQDPHVATAFALVEDGIPLGVSTNCSSEFSCRAKLRCISVLFLPRRCGFGKLFPIRSGCGMEVLCG